MVLSTSTHDTPSAPGKADSLGERGNGAAVLSVIHQHQVRKEPHGLVRGQDRHSAFHMSTVQKELHTHRHGQNRLKKQSQGCRWRQGPVYWLYHGGRWASPGMPVCSPPYRGHNCAGPEVRGHRHRHLKGPGHSTPPQRLLLPC